MKKVYPCRIPVSEEEYVQYLPFEEFEKGGVKDGNRFEGKIIDFSKARKRLERQTYRRMPADRLPLLIS